MPRRFMTLHRFAKEIGVSYATAHSYARRGHFPIYRLHGVKEACVDAAEARAAVDKLPARTARPGYGSFGPDAIVRDLSNHAAEYEVAR